MLSPDVIAVSDELAQAYATISRVDAFAYAAMNTRIGQLTPDPDWLGPVRNELALLNSTGAQWQFKKPDIWTPLLLQFVDYSSQFAGVAQVAQELGDDTGTWTQLLNKLSVSLGNAATASRAAEGQFVLQINNLNNVRQVFDTSLDNAWRSLAGEEQEMIAIAEQATRLQDCVNSLQSNLTASEIRGGKAYVQSAVSISYTLVSTVGTEIPYLNIAGLLFTVGSLAYDLIVTDPEIRDAIGQMVELRVNASEEAQAAAMSKSVIQLIDSFDRQLLAVERRLPSLAQMWSGEKEKVNQVIHSLQAGAKPSHSIDLVSLPSAAAAWNHLAGMAVRLTQAAAPGTPVSITTTSQNSIQEGASA